jgi:hypothetical protein
VFYTDDAAARRAGAVERGWIPDWLPKGAHDIHEAHDIDTSRSVLTFVFDSAAGPALDRSCTQVQPAAVRAVPFKTSWWPNDVPPSSFTTPRHAYYQCIDGAYLAMGNGHLYRWRP